MSFYFTNYDHFSCKNISGCLQRLLVKGHKLIDNETNNRAELYMSILCKFNSGKRLNLTSRGSFQTRAVLSGLRYNQGPDWQTKVWKKCLGRSPGKNFKKLCQIKRRNHETQARRKLLLGYKHTQKKRCPDVNTDYGKIAEQPALTSTEFESEKSRILNLLKVI